MLSSSRMLAGPVIAFFLAAIVLSFVAWRQIRRSAAQPTIVSRDASTAESSNGPSNSSSIQPQTTSVVAQTVPGGQPVARLQAAAADSTVQIHIENRFSDATLSVWIDDKLAYAHPLRDGHKKRLVLLGGGAKETLTIRLPAGKHGLGVRVRSAAERYEQSKTISGAFRKGGEKVLSINFEKRTKEMRLALE